MTSCFLLLFLATKTTLCQQKLAASAKSFCYDSAYMLCQQKFHVSAMLWQQNLISPHKCRYLIMTQQKYALLAKNLTIQWNELIQQNTLSAKTCWVIKMPDDDSTKDRWVSKKFAVSAKISWFGKICCVSKIWLVRTNPWWWLSKNMLYQQKIWQVSEMS